MSITIDVTQDDIGDGTAGECTRCPIAIAACRALADFCMVDAFTISIFRSGASYPVPPEAWKFMEAFDAGLPIKPFRFEVSDAENR